MNEGSKFAEQEASLIKVLSYLVSLPKSVPVGSLPTPFFWSSLFFDSIM
jgi:hypothetical protein